MGVMIRYAFNSWIRYIMKMGYLILDDGRARCSLGTCVLHLSTYIAVPHTSQPDKGHNLDIMRIIKSGCIAIDLSYTWITYGKLSRHGTSYHFLN